MKMKKNSSLYAYLDATGVLETGSDEQIKAAKRAYYKEYQARWKRENRSGGRAEVTVAVSAAEAKTIDEAAKRHGRSRARIVREACMAYLTTRRFVVPDAAATGSVLHSLTVVITMLQQLLQDGSAPFWEGVELIRQINALDEEVRAALLNPATVEEFFVNAVRRDPAARARIAELIKRNELSS